MSELKRKGAGNRMNQKEKNMNKRKYKAGGLSLVLLFSLLLGGCTLAKPELQQTKEDKLCGILVTVGEQEVQRRKEQELENMTFSSIKELEESLTSSAEAEGIRQPDGTYVFEGVEGHMLGIKEETEEDEVPYVHFINDGFFTEVEANTAVTDEGKKDSVSGVILAGESINEAIYMNPVYSREDGSCYVILSSGGFLMGGMKTEGEAYGQTFQWEAAKEINGKKETDSIEIHVSLKMAVPVKRVCVRMYNDKDELLKKEEVLGGTEEVSVSEETAYVIVEEEASDGRIKRSLYNLDESWDMIHQINYPGNNGLIQPVYLEFKK